MDWTLVAAEFAVHTWPRELAGSLSTTELAARCGLSRLRLGRWLSGRSRPRLHDSLALVDWISGRVSDLVGALAPIDAVPKRCRARSRPRLEIGPRLP